MALIVRNLSKRYGAQATLRGVDLTLSGGVVALLGPNGSGKSTLLQALATLCKPDTGELSFEGWVYGQHQRSLRANIGYLPQEFEMPDTLTPRRLLTYLARLRGGEVGQVVEALRLEAFVDQPFRKLSGGQLRLVGIAQALLGNPKLLLLDELARGLDAVERERVFRVVTTCGKLTIFSTHIPEEAERIAQTVIVLHEGQVLFCGAVETLRAYAIGQVYELSASRETLPQMMASLSVSRITPHQSHPLLRVVGEPSSPEATVVAPSLEDAYLLLTHDLLKR
jgi:ABC-2 type transport system ATP-binding protein